MENSQGSMLLCKVLDVKEEILVDREGNIFYPNLSVGIVSHSKEHFWELNSQGEDVLNVHSSFLYNFYIQHTLHFLEFVEWCVNKYSFTERVIMNSGTTKILCEFNAIVFREVLILPENFP